MKNIFKFDITSEEIIEIILRYPGKDEYPRSLLRSLISRNSYLYREEKFDIDDYGNYNPGKLVLGKYSLWECKLSKETKNLMRIFEVILKNKDKEN